MQRRRRQPDTARELDRLVRSREEADRDVEQARERRDAAEARRDELAAIDGREALGELTAEEASAARGDVQAEISAAEEALERAERVRSYVVGRVVEAAHTLADELLVGPGEALRKEEVALEEIDAGRAAQLERVEAARALEAEAQESAEAIRCEHDPKAHALRNERDQHRKRQIEWFLRTGGLRDALLQLPPDLRPIAEARLAEAAEHGRERQEARAADREAALGEVREHEPFARLAGF